MGNDWLKRHNPSIDWKKYTIDFNWCPEAINYPDRLTLIDTDNPEFHPEEGIKINILDMLNLAYTHKVQMKLDI